MNAKDKMQTNEIVSLNDELQSEFAVQELEQRLETDPILVGSITGGSEGTMEDCTLCIVLIE